MVYTWHMWFVLRREVAFWVGERDGEGIWKKKDVVCVCLC